MNNNDHGADIRSCVLGRMVLLLVLTLVVTGHSLRGQVSIFGSAQNYATIQGAIDAAQTGDKVVISAGIYFETVAIVNKHIEIEGDPIGGTQIKRQTFVGRNVIVDQSAPGTTILRNLLINYGASPLPSTTPAGHRGGCVFAKSSLPAATTTLRFENCQIIGGTANNGCGIYAGVGVNLELVDTTVSNCLGFMGPALFGNAGIGIYANADISLIGCDVVNNDCHYNNITPSALYPEGFGAGLYLSPAVGTATIEDCLFSANRANAGGAIAAHLAGSLQIRRCEFRGNLGHLPNTGAALHILADMGPNSAPSLLIENCLFHENSSFAADVSTILSRVPQTEINFSTFTRNGPWNASSSVMDMGIDGPNSLSSLNIRNCVVADNSESRIEIEGIESLTLSNSLFIDAPIVTNVTNVTAMNNIQGLNPAWVSFGGLDYRLRRGSPCMDEGLSSATDPTEDLLGAPRLVGAGVDMGCYEIQNVTAPSAYAGSLSVGDVLLFNGSAGGPSRTLSVDAGSTCTISVLAPVPGVFSNFILWGYLGVPLPAEEFPIYFAGGNMAFSPHLVDLSNPSLFTFSNNLMSPAFGLLPSTAAPWSATGPCSPFPVSITLQGLIDDGTGALRLTNGITLHAR